MKRDRMDIGLLVLRVLAGGLIALQGWSKMSGGVEGFQGFVDSLGLPLPGLLAWLIPIFELSAGLAIVAGLLTRQAATAFVLFFLGTTFYVKFGQLGAGLVQGEATAEADLLYLGAFALLATVGAGVLSIDGMRSRSTHESTPAAV
jgi:putative oxidoreductase